jgi:uncharacterized protein YeaO (DUF488 family)
VPDVALKRAYDPASVSDGLRVLVDRLWPRGVSRDTARIDAWLKDLAPSDELRRWFHARPAQWPAFRKRYLEELHGPAASAALDELYGLAARRRKLTLIYSSRNEEHNNAVVLQQLLAGMRKPPSTSGPAAAARGVRRAVRKR